MNTDKEKTFIRQTTLPEIGEIGQEKLNKSRVAIIGCGGSTVATNARRGNAVKVSVRDAAAHFVEIELAANL